MNSQSYQGPAIPPEKAHQKGTFYHLQVVISVAFILATLFTAWTPANLLPGNLAEKLSEALAPLSPTQLVVNPTDSTAPNPRVGIVVGHWGDNDDPGAVCPDGLTEFQVNQSIATLARDFLMAEGMDVDLLKEFDYRLIDYQATVLLSIHADSCEYINDLATGFKVSAALSNTFPERASRLTACLRSRYQEITGLQFHSGSVTPDMTSYHAFNEIHPETNAAIIETGFLNLDRQILTQQQDVVAHGISNGILCYIRNEDITPPEAP